jgi:transposase-like protein
MTKERNNMKDKHKAKRDQYPDSLIMDALDAEMFNVTATAKRLGLSPNTLRVWIAKSDNLSNYVALGNQSLSEEIRDTLLTIMRDAKHDPKTLGAAIQAAKIVYDKLEANRSELRIESNSKHVFDVATEAKIREILGDD